MNGTIQLLKFSYLALFSKHYVNISDLSSFCIVIVHSIPLMLNSVLNKETNIYMCVCVCVCIHTEI